LTSPNHLIKAFQTTVKMVPIVVRSQRVCLTVECEFTFRDAVTVTANNWSEVRLIFLVGGDVIVTERYVAECAVGVRDFNRDHARSIVDYLDLRAAFVCQRINVDRLTISGFSKRLFVNM